MRHRDWSSSDRHEAWLRRVVCLRPVTGSVCSLLLTLLVAMRDAHSEPKQHTEMRQRNWSSSKRHAACPAHFTQHA